jgi:hypothetical protein
MRRLLAHVALTAICVGFLSPLLLAAELSSVHACCLRKGTHHCHELSDDASEHEFRVKQNPCPYSGRLTFSSFHGLRAAEFDLGLPWICGVVHQTAFEHGVLAAVREWSARGPPVVLL